MGTKEPWAPVPVGGDDLTSLLWPRFSQFLIEVGERKGHSDVTEGWKHGVFPIWGLSWQEFTSHSREPHPPGLFSHSMLDIQDGISSALLPSFTERTVA